MVAVPPATPLIIPELPATVAIVASLVVHDPPDVALLNVVVFPWHTPEAPSIGVGVFTLTVIVAVQPPPNVV